MSKREKQHWLEMETKQPVEEPGHLLVPRHLFRLAILFENAQGDEALRNLLAERSCCLAVYRVLLQGKRGSKTAR